MGTQAQCRTYGRGEHYAPSTSWAIALEACVPWPVFADVLKLARHSVSIALNLRTVLSAQ